MNAFDRCRCIESGLLRNAEQGSAFEHEEGPEALAAAEHGVTHGLDQAGWAATARLSGENFGQPAFNEGCGVAKGRVKLWQWQFSRPNSLEMPLNMAIVRGYEPAP